MVYLDQIYYIQPLEVSI